MNDGDAYKGDPIVVKTTEKRSTFIHEITESSFEFKNILIQERSVTIDPKTNSKKFGSWKTKESYNVSYKENKEELEQKGKVIGVEESGEEEQVIFIREKEIKITEPTGRYWNGHSYVLWINYDYYTEYEYRNKYYDETWKEIYQIVPKNNGYKLSFLHKIPNSEKRKFKRESTWIDKIRK